MKLSHLDHCYDVPSSTISKRCCDVYTFSLSNFIEFKVPYLRAVGDII